MKSLLLIFLIAATRLYSQPGYHDIDRKAGNIRGENLDSLAKQLSSLGKTDREKARAFFRWITENVDYNLVIYNRNKKSPGLFYEDADDTAATLPPLNERVAAKVLRKRVAFCDGYSRLFAALCEKAGIRCEVIHGYARTNRNRSGRFSVNHTWNAVYLDSAWHLLDVTWASGFISYSNQYIPQYNDIYFLTPPEEFILDHYPEDPQWTLLAETPVYREFNQSAFRYGGYIKSGITYYQPAKGIIEVAAGDSLKIEVKANREVKNFFAADTLYVDSSVSGNTQFHVRGDRVQLVYPVTADTGRWLYVFYNDEAVLRYRLNIKNSKTGAAPVVNK